MPPERNELLLDIFKRRYDEELERGKSLDGKASNLIGYVTIVSGIIIGLGTFSILEKLAAVQYYIPYLLGIAALLGSIVASLFAVKITQYHYSPGDEALLEYYTTDNQPTYDSVATSVLYYLMDAAKKNSVINERKALKIKVSWISLVIGIGSLIVYGGIFALFGSVGTNQLVKVLIGDAIENIKSKDIKDALTHLTLADQQISSANGNSTSKLLIEDAIQNLKNYHLNEANTSLAMIHDP
jgi:hypothetical protein